MRRALRLLLLVSLAAAIAAAISGWHALWLLGQTEGEAEALAVLEGPSRLVHVALAHVTVLLSGLAASMAFVLGLQGVLDAGGRRALAGALLVLAPTIMWLAFGAEVTGGVDRDLVESGLLAGEITRLQRSHALMEGAGLIVALFVSCVLSWRLARGPEQAAD